MKVVVVGAGVSGLLSALVLERRGHEVIIFEKNHVGGNYRSYEVEGDSGVYKVDTGPHIVTRLEKGPFKYFIENYIDLLPKFVPHGSYYVRIDSKLKKFPWSFKDLLTFDAIPARDRLKLIEGLFLMLKADEDLTLYEGALQMNFSDTTMRFLDALSYFMTGVSMKEMPISRLIDAQKYKSEESLLIKKILNYAYQEGGKDQYYPKGGIQNITNSIVNSLRTRIVMEEVKEIFEDCKGVATEEKEYECDFVVYSGFAKELPNLIELPEEYREHLRSLKIIKSLTIWLGIRKPVFHNHGSEIWVDTDPYTWVVPTSNYDKTLAPEGRQLAGFAFVENNYEKAMKAIYEVFPDIDIDMIHKQVLIPEKAAFTTKEFPKTKTPVENLYLVGTDTVKKSQGLTRASYSVLNLIEVLKKEKKL